MIDKRKLTTIIILASVLLVTLLTSGLVQASERDRLNRGSPIGAVYRRGRGIEIYRIDAQGKGTLALTITRTEIRRVERRNPTTNTLIKATPDGLFAVYLLSTGEFQANLGPDAEGKVEVVTWRGLPPEAPPVITHFNVFDILNPHSP